MPARVCRPEASAPSTASAQQPLIIVNGYAIYSFNNPTIVRLYNTQTGAQTSLAGPGAGPDGYRPGNAVFAGEHTVGYTLGAFSTSATPAPTRLVVVRT